MSDFNSSKIRLSVPILMSRQVVLPGWTSDITLSTTEQKAMFNEIMDFGDYSNKTLNYVGVVPIKSSRKAPQVGDIGAYCKILSCLAKLGAKDVMKIRVLGEKRMKIEDISSTSNYCVAEISILEDIEEPFQDVIDTLEKHDFPFSWPRGKPLNQVSLQQSLKHLEKGLEDCISRQNSMSREKEIKLLETLRFSDRLALLLTAFDSKSNGGNLPPFTTRVQAFVSVPGNGSKKIPILPTFGGVRLPPTTNIFSLRDGLAEPGINNLSTKIQEAGMPAEVHKIAMEEFNRLSSMPAHGAEHALLRNYLETLVSLPWRVASTDVVDVNKAKAELESHHYGMEKVKRRVLEYLAVKQLTKSHLRGPILSFVGPPGVGKTSIARSIASILGRKFHRIGLGGMCDASDIRGSRRTYIGSMPGRIIKAIQYCGTNNPVILLDEIDKMGSGHLNGNPLAVLLEVLDPEQNSQFTDHYLGVPFDLSQVIFVGTANSMDSIPPALIDRIEVIEVNGYTEEEKFHIARDFIIPKSLAEHGLDEEQVVIPDESLQFIISSYSRESGVRTLERKIGALLRDAALKIAADLANNVTPISLMIDVETTKEVLGGSYYHKDADLRWTDGSVPGVVVGLAYTALGGEILPIEASKIVPGKGKLILTGKLGKVISESAQIAFDWFKTAAMKYGIYEDMTALDLHLHLPAGAVSKDGPSAGIALATALVSLFSGSPPIPRIALTGEITLQGHVLPVGGLKEKLSAARKVGITKVILPKKCENSLRDIPQHLLDQLELMLVEHMSEVVECAFDGAVAENSPLVSKL